jgi:hypothetical protein
MATSNILGLFVSPEQYQAQQLAQQQANEQQRAINFAGLDPRGQAVYGTFLGAQQLGRGLGGLLGVQDPQLQRIRQRDQLMQSINPADPASLMAGIQAATNAGDQELALTLTDFMNKQGSEMALAQQRTAQANREQQQAVPADIAKARELGVLTTALAELEKTPVGTPGREQQISLLKTQIEALKPAAKAGEQIKELVIADEVVKLEELLRTAKPDSTEAKNAKIKLDLLKGTKKDQNQIKELVIADEIVKLDKTIRDNLGKPDTPEVLDAKSKVAVLRSQLKSDKPNLTVVGEAKSGVDKGKAVYVDETNDQQFVYDFKDGKQVRKPFVGDVDRVTSQTTVSATSTMLPGERKFVEKLGALDAEDVAAARANRNNAIAALNTLSELSRLNQSGVTSGAFADGRVGAVNLLNTLGLVGAKDVGILANSQTFNKVAGDLILATLGGKLGAGFSNEDRKFIAGLVPSLETSRQARQQLIDFMTKKNQLIIDESTRLEDYARENSGLKGFKAKIPIVNAPAPGSLQAMSETELKAAIDKAKKKEGK